jgi:AcrR family transcriptional regulator
VPVAKGETIDVGRTRGKLLRAAAELFYREGTAVGVEEIARRAAVSKLTIYRHFGSKDGLLDEVLRQRSDDVIAWLQAASDRPNDPVERLLAVFDALHGWYTEARFRGCAIVNAATQSLAPSSPARQVAPNHLGHLRDLLTNLAADAGAREPALAGRQLLILLEGATVVAALTGDADAATDARELARSVLPPPSTPNRARRSRSWTSD